MNKIVEKYRLNLNLCQPVPLNEDITIYPVTINEICHLGESKFQILLNVLVSSREDLLKLVKFRDEHVSTYQIVCGIAYSDSSYKESLIQAFNLFLHTTVSFINNQFFIIKDEKIVTITDSIFNSIVSIVKAMNIPESEVENNKQKYHNKAAEFYDQLRQKYSKMLHKEDQSQHIGRIVEIVANCTNANNYETVGRMTLGQLYQSYFRLLMWDKFHILYPLLPYADKNEQLIKHHWAEEANLKNAKE